MIESCRTMDTQFIKPDLSGKISITQMQENVDRAVNEVDGINSGTKSYANIPTYRTVRYFYISEVYILFGLKKSAFFRLTKSPHAKHLPTIVVVHCNISRNKSDVEPAIVDGKLFISHDYFKSWICSEDNEKFEEDLLQLIMEKISNRDPFQ